MNAIRIHRHGGPETMQWEEVTLAPPGPGEVRIRHTAIGVNFSEVNVRRGGFYLGQAPTFPLIPGNEAAGVVVDIGAHVTSVKPGDRVAYVGASGEWLASPGAYADMRNVPADRLLHVPAWMRDEQAAAMLVKGLTAWIVIRQLSGALEGRWILVHAAASGVGTLLCQWAKHLGARVIGTVGSEKKAEFAGLHGCDHAILYRMADFVAETRAIVPDGVSVVYDAIGGDSFLRSLDCVAKFGRVVNYGNVSGSVPPVDLRVLSRRSISIARAGLGSVLDDMNLVRSATAELFGLVAQNVLHIEIARTYALREARLAHEDLEAGRSMGSLLLVP